jgi:hypothetical protein
MLIRQPRTPGWQGEQPAPDQVTLAANHHETKMFLPDEVAAAGSGGLCGEGGRGGEGRGGSGGPSLATATDSSGNLSSDD